MKILNYTVEVSFHSLQPINHFKVHSRGLYKHLVWYKLSALWGPTGACEECGIETGLEALCQPCYDHFYCECGVRLEDSYGSPGDGLCRRCD